MTGTCREQTRPPLPLPFGARRAAQAITRRTDPLAVACKPNPIRLSAIGGDNPTAAPPLTTQTGQTLTSPITHIQYTTPRSTSQAIRPPVAGCLPTPSRRDTSLADPGAEPAYPGPPLAGAASGLPATHAAFAPWPPTRTSLRSRPSGRRPKRPQPRLGAAGPGRPARRPRRRLPGWTRASASNESDHALKLLGHADIATSQRHRNLELDQDRTVSEAIPTGGGQWLDCLAILWYAVGTDKESCMLLDPHPVLSLPGTLGGWHCIPTCGHSGRSSRRQETRK
jgi:hypothetical protein